MMSRSKSKKVRVLVHSNYTRLKTGFGKNMRNIFLALHNDPDIELIEAANGPEYGADLKTPWESYGTMVSDPRMLREIKKSPVSERAAKYGYYTIDEIVEKSKPDVYLGIEDIWAFTKYDKKPWWNEIKTIIWTTLDSLPIHEEAFVIEEGCDKMLCWASFATEEMNRLGRSSVETLHGAVDYSNFYEFPDKDKKKKDAGLGGDYVIGFVFKNQLRKSVPNLLEGFKLFKERNPEISPKLLLHTDWENDGNTWNIPKYIEEKSISKEDILTTYICGECGKFHVRNYDGEDKKCPSCGRLSCKTKNVSTRFLDEGELNEIYNLMDVYCHPFTSGGQELPIQEAKAAGLITLVTDYSCGSDSAYEDIGGLPMEWSEYREPSSRFIKATTDPKSICKQLERVLNMSDEEALKIKDAGQRNIKEKFNTELIVSQLKDVILESEKKKKKEEEKKEESKKDESVKLEDLLGDESPDDRILVSMPRSAGDVLMVNSLIENLKDLYPDKKIYVATNEPFYAMIEDNPSVFKVLPYLSSFESNALTEGVGDNYGLFKIAFTPNITTQRSANYMHNGADKNTLLK